MNATELRTIPSGYHYLFVPDGIDDEEILNFLSNPGNKFSYSVRANGSVLVTEPWPVLAPDLRSAVRFIISRNSELA